jgi:hypothetical protein
MLSFKRVEGKAIFLRPEETSVNRLLEGNRVVRPYFKIICKKKCFRTRGNDRGKGINEYNEKCRTKDGSLGNTTSDREFGRQRSTNPHSRGPTRDKIGQPEREGSKDTKPFPMRNSDVMGDNVESLREIEEDAVNLSF